MGVPNLFFVFPPQGTRNYEKSLVVQKWADQLPNRVYDISKANLIVVVSGDGGLFHTGHEYYPLRIPLFGINRGTVGFALNHLSDDVMKCDGKSFLNDDDLVFVGMARNRPSESVAPPAIQFSVSV